MCHTWKASHILWISIKRTDIRIGVQPTIGPSVSWACVQREWDLCLLLWSILIHYYPSPTPAVSVFLLSQQYFMYFDFIFVLQTPETPLFMLGNNHQNTKDPQLYLHPTLSCGVTVKARYEQNSQTRGIMPCNVCLVISWLLQTGRGDVNVINLARLTQRARSGI